MNNPNFQFNYNDKIYQIRFSYPDKWDGIYRKYTAAILFEKVINPEDKKDFVWQEVDRVLAKCKFQVYIDNDTKKLFIEGDKFDKWVGKKISFTKLINKNFERDFRRQLWIQFFDTFGITTYVTADICKKVFEQIRNVETA